MDASQRLKTVAKALEALRTLNRLGSMTRSELASALGIPRTTAYRILESLVAEGYVVQLPDDARYRVTSRVLLLSEGYTPEVWVSDIAKPEIQDLTDRLVWPVSVSTLTARDGSMELVVQETTDRESPLTFYKTLPGQIIPIAQSAVGRIHLAFCSLEQRRRALKLLSSSGELKFPLALLEQILDQTKKQGYHLLPDNNRGEAILAVPIRPTSGIVGALAVRFFRTAMTDAKAIKTLLPPLQDTADRITQRIDEGNSNIQ